MFLRAWATGCGDAFAPGDVEQKKRRRRLGRWKRLLHGQIAWRASRVSWCRCRISAAKAHQYTIKRGFAPFRIATST